MKSVKRYKFIVRPVFLDLMTPTVIFKYFFSEIVHNMFALNTTASFSCNNIVTQLYEAN
jgi:hypothetical protein